MNNRLFFPSALIVVLMLLLAACSQTQVSLETLPASDSAEVEGEVPAGEMSDHYGYETTPNLDQTVALPHLKATMSYPTGWYVLTSDEGMTIADYESQVASWGTEPPIEGYSAESFIQPVELLVNEAGLPEGFGPQEFMELIVGMFGAAEPTSVEEITVLGVPAVRMRSAISFDGDSASHPIDAVFAVTDDRAIFVVIHAPDEELMETMAPTWSAMLESITPSGTDTSS